MLESGCFKIVKRFYAKPDGVKATVYSGFVTVLIFGFFCQFEILCI